MYQRLSYFIIVSLLCFSCKNATEDRTQPGKDFNDKEDTTSIFSNNITAWLESNLQTNKKLTLNLEHRWTDDSIQWKPFKIDESFLLNYQSVLRWSQDSAYILDIGSYGSVPSIDKSGRRTLEEGEPDTEIALINYHKQQRARLIFVGPSSNIADGKWIQKNEVVVLGTFVVDNNTDTLMWLINVTDNSFKLYNVKI